MNATVGCLLCERATLLGGLRELCERPLRRFHKDKPIRFLISILILTLPAVAQIRVQQGIVSQSASATAFRLTVNVQEPVEGSIGPVLAGERTYVRPGGDIIVVRQIPLQIKVGEVSVTTTEGAVHSLSLAASPGNSAQLPALAYPGGERARITHSVPSGDAVSALLEVVVASYEPSSGTLRYNEDLIVHVAYSGTAGTMPSLLKDPTSPGTLSSTMFAREAGAPSRFAAGEWYRFDVQETGMYKLTRTWFRNAGVSEADLRAIDRLRLFGNGGTPVPEALTAARPQGITELARRIVDADGDNELDDGDYVLFYGRSVRHWSYDPAQKRYAHTMNPYMEKTPCYFTFDAASSGRPMGTVQSAASAPTAVSQVLGRIAVDEDKVNFVSSGRRWVGTSFDVSSTSSTFMNQLPGLVSGQPITYRAVFFSRSATIDTFRVTEHDTPVGNPVLMFTSDVGSVDQIYNYAYESPVVTFTHPGSLPDSRSVLKFTFGPRNQAAKGWIDWFEIFYRRSLTASEDRLFFPAPDTSATLSYTVQSFSSRATRVFDVTDHANVTEVVGLEFDPVNASVCTFRLSHTAGSPAEIAVLGEGGYLTPQDPRRITPTALRGYGSPVSFIIISPPEFLEEANRLKQHRESLDGIPTLVANIDDIFREFGGGTPDPFAVRDFLAYARSSYIGPVRYVLFFGNGHFDYRNISTSERNWVLPVETAESNFQINSFTSDDFFVQLDPGSARISLAIGRLPGRSLGEMEAMVEKIIRYDTESPLDSWRNRISFVADDGQTSSNPFEGSLHTSQAESLARGFTPKTFEQQKIYLVEYPTVISASGRRKPAANRDIVSAFNEGSLIINFTGHGNPRLWTHEAVFTREADIPQLRNASKLPLLVAATCNYAQWDDPNEQSSGELLVTMPGGGAIAVVTATRSVFSFDNAELNYRLYENLFKEDSAGMPLRLGDAFWAMKQVRFGTNDQKYHLLGDPTVRLLRPQGSLTIDSINGVATSDSVVSVPTLGVVTVSGAVRNGDSTVSAGFNGTGLMELFDSKRIISVPEWGGYQYEKSGTALYRGEISVAGGRFAARVPVPKDVTFGSRARLSLYALGAVADAVGTTEQLVISGTDTTAAVDTTGPQIIVRVHSQDFRSGDVVPQDPTLIVELMDESGINTSTIGIGHNLEAVLSADQRVIDLSNDYKGNLDTYQSGRAVRTLTDLPDGRQSLRVRAWDIHNNSSTAEVDFEVRSGGEADLFHVVNYPNPFSRTTAFTMQRISSAPVDIRIRIYTVAGRMIKEIESWSITDRFVSIPWDGRDREGNEIANGVYLYKVIMKSVDTGETKEVIEKLVVMR